MSLTQFRHMILGKKKIPIEELLKIDHQLPSVPPVQEYTSMTGMLTLSIKIDYINQPFDKNFQFRYTLWGSSQKIYFWPNKSQLKITAPLESLSRYLWDMNILCIQVVSTLQSNNIKDMNSTQRLKSPQNNNKSTSKKPQKKMIGCIYVPLKKYFINQTISSFTQQKFVIIDPNKKRIGQIGLDLTIEMLQDNGTAFKNYIKRMQSLNSHQNSQNKINQKNEVSILERNSFTNQRISYDEPDLFTKIKDKKVTIMEKPNLKYNDLQKLSEYSQVREPIIGQQKTGKSLESNKFTTKNYFSYGNIEFQGTEKQVINQAEEIYEERNFEDKRKEKSMRKIYVQSRKNLHQTRQIYHPKQQQNELQAIKKKWGANHPTVELMKLRLDEVKYLEKEPINSNITNLDGKGFQGKDNCLNIHLKELNLLLTKTISQGKYISLSQLSSKDSKTIFRTEITLQNFIQKNPKSSNSLNLDRMITLNGFLMTDKIIVETFDASCQISIKQLMGSGGIMDLRRKDSKKRAYELKFQVDIFTKDETSIKRALIQSQINKENVRQKNAGGQKTREINKILNQTDRDKSSSKNKLDNRNKKLNVPQRQNGELAPEQEKNKFSQLSRSQNKKDIPHDKIQNLLLQKKQDISKKITVNKQNQIKTVFTYFQQLYTCEDESCFQLVNKLSKYDYLHEEQAKTEDFQSLQKLLFNQKFDSLLPKNSILPLKQIIKNFFGNKFSSFYSCFLSYKEINQRYQTVLYKLKQALKRLTNNQHSTKGKPFNLLQKIFNVINYVKKHKKDKITFGLISSHDLMDIICEKLSFSKNSNQQMSQIKNSVQQKVITQKSELINQENNRFKMSQNFSIESQIMSFVQALLTMFTRYESDLIKISQMQKNLEDSIKVRQKRQENSQFVEMNMNLGFLVNLHKDVNHIQAQKQVGTYKQTFLYHFIEENKQHLGVNIGLQSYSKQKSLSIYDLLYGDRMNLSIISSSFVETNYRNRTEQQDYPLVTEQGQAQIIMHNKKLATENDNNPSQQKKRLRTEEAFIMNEKQRLNTEDQNVIEIFNQNNKIKENKQQQHFSKQNTLNDQTVGVQVTKRQYFQPQSENKNQFQQKDQQIKQNQFLAEKDTYIKPLTNYISIKCTIKRPLQAGKSKSPYKNQTQSQNLILNLFYLNLRKQNNTQNKIIEEEFKISAKQVNSQPKIVPNTFKINQKEQKVPQQFLKFRIQSFQDPQSKDKKSMKIFQNQKFLTIKNITGKQSYPIQTQQGKICLIVEIQIDEVNQQDMKIYLQNEKQQNLNKQDQKVKDQKFNRILLVNVKNLISLNYFQQSYSFRIIYESENKIEYLKDVELAELMDKKILSQKYQQNNQIQNTRHIPLNMELFKINLNNLSPKKHIIKIFTLKKSNKISTMQKLQTKNIKTSSKNTKLKKSQPVSRFLNDQISNTLTEITNDVIDFVCQFQFDLRKIKNNTLYGIEKENIWLVDGPFRLQIDFFDIKYQKWNDDGNLKQKDQNNFNDFELQMIWEKKIYKILNVLQISNIQSICQRFIRYLQNQQAKEQQNQEIYETLLKIISQTMDYRLTQREIFLSLCFPQRMKQHNHQNSQPIQNELTIKDKLDYFLKLFSIDPKLHKLNSDKSQESRQKLSVGSLYELYQQFETFDLEHEGLLTFPKFQVTKRILPQLNHLKIQNFIVNFNKNSQNLIVNDFRISQRQNKKPLIDYLKILWFSKEKYQQNFFFERLRRKDFIKAQPQLNQRKIKMHLDKQFYQNGDQQSQNEESYQRQIANIKNNSKPKQIGDSVMRAFNNQKQTNKKVQQTVMDRLKLSKDESLLSQTRKQWQQMLEKNTNKKQSINVDRQASRLEQVLKSQIKKEDLNKKFQLFKDGLYSDQSQNEQQQSDNESV